MPLIISFRRSWFSTAAARSAWRYQTTNRSCWWKNATPALLSRRGTLTTMIQANCSWQYKHYLHLPISCLLITLPLLLHDNVKFPVVVHFVTSLFYLYIVTCFEPVVCLETQVIGFNRSFVISKRTLFLQHLEELVRMGVFYVLRLVTYSAPF